MAISLKERKDVKRGRSSSGAEGLPAKGLTFLILGREGRRAAPVNTCARLHCALSWPSYQTAVPKFCFSLSLWGWQSILSSRTSDFQAWSPVRSLSTVLRTREHAYRTVGTFPRSHHFLEDVGFYDSALVLHSV